MKESIGFLALCALAALSSAEMPHMTGAFLPGRMVGPPPVLPASSVQRSVKPDGLPVESPSRFTLLPPPMNETQRAVTMRNVFLTWIAMPLDHFNPQNPYQFWMRYMFNEEFFEKDGDPIFIMVGGEWEIVAGWLMTGNMYEMARENHGYLIYTEHRYYGGTVPFAFYDNETLQYLNVDQALADLAYFIRDLKKQPRFAASEVILVGGSYAANMVLWFKQRYPHLVKGTIASSGPIEARQDFHGYLEVVHEAFRSEGGQECIDTVKAGLDQIIAHMQTEDGRRILEETFNVCVPLDWEGWYDAGYFTGFLTWTFSGSVQTARPGSIRLICDSFASNVFGETPLEKIQGYIRWSRGSTTCVDLRYSGYINWFRLTPVSDTKAWYYQTCTEYAFWQIAPSSGTMFDGFSPWSNIDWYNDMCEQVFDPRFNRNYTAAAVERVNLMFGGLEPDVNNTVNIHGAIDPWHALGVHDHHLKDSSPTITVPRASHCFDLSSWLQTDTILMTQAKQAARRFVHQWLNE